MANVIQAVDDPAAESWRNINAIDDLVHAILINTGQLTVAALAGNAAAGGVMLAAAPRRAPPRPTWESTSRCPPRR